MLNILMFSMPELLYILKLFFYVAKSFVNNYWLDKISKAY